MHLYLPIVLCSWDPCPLLRTLCLLLIHDTALLHHPSPAGPKPEVLEGLASMYQLLVAAEYKDAKTRARFLGNLLKPFGAACSLADAAAAAAEDCHKLAFLVNVAAALPFRRADEPLLLIHAINGHVSRQAQEVLDCLRRQLSAQGLRAKMGLEEDADDDADQAAAAAAGGDVQAEDQAAGAEAAPAACQKQQQQQRLSPPFPQALLAPLKASLCLSMLLVLKQYLMAAYGLSDERVAGFELKGAKYQGEAKALVSRAKSVPEFSLGVVNLRALGDATGDLLCEAFKTFRGLLDNDAANYRWAGTCLCACVLVCMCECRV
jgi:cohesin loading factor subunit SCC2